MKQIAADIKANDFKPVYLLYGDEPYLTRLYAARLTDAMIPPAARAMNLTAPDGDGFTAASAIDALETPPFLSERRLVVLRHANLFAAKSAEAETLAAYLPDIPPGAALLIVESAVDRRTKLYKQILKTGHAAECNTPSEKELTDWLTRQAKAQGKVMTRGAAASLLRRQTAMDALAAELEKLCAHADAEITPSDVDALCQKPLEARIFDLTDAIAERRPAAALALYADMLALRESPFMVLTMVARQFRLMLQCTALRHQPNPEIAARLGVKPYVVTLCLRQSRAYDLPELENALRDCLDTDVAIKTGQIGERLGVEMLIARQAGT